jgi:phosphoglycerol transferase
MYSLVNTKAVIDHGWWWRNPDLSAPFGLHMIAYPSSYNVDMALVWLVARFSDDPALVLNVAWLSTFFIGSAVALGCMMLLGVRPLPAAVLATLYAVLPFAFFRHIGHFMLSPYLVPLPCTLALLVATGRVTTLPRSRYLVVLAGLGLMGLNYIYFAAFATVTIALSVAVALASGLRWPAVRSGIVALLVLGASVALNLVPTLVTWEVEGKPYADFKSPADTETFALKIRHLVSPVPGHTFPPFARWLARTKDIPFVGENENVTAALGLVLTCGFLWLVGRTVLRRQRAEDEEGYLGAAGRLTLGLLLIATVGGFGVLFSIAVSPDIRAYNRIVVFIAFFAAYAVAQGLSRAERAASVHGRFGRIGYAALLIAVLGFGVYDQGQAARPLVARHRADRAEAAALRPFLDRVEAHLPPNARVCQLPFTPFPPDGGTERMPPYDHAKAYVLSHRLRFTWPSLSRLHQDWAAAIGEKPLARQIEDIALSGFDAVWVDRFGYADDAAALERTLTETLRVTPLVSDNRRWSVFDLRPYGAQLEHALGSERAARRRRAVLAPFEITWEGGFYPSERNGVTGSTFRWARPRSRMAIRNRLAGARTATLHYVMQTGGAEPQDVIVEYDGRSERQTSSNLAAAHHIALRFEPGETKTVSFDFRGRTVVAPGDPRTLAFNLSEVRVEEREER